MLYLVHICNHVSSVMNVYMIQDIITNLSAQTLTEFLVTAFVR
jgi:hypothetical protein